MINRVIRHSVYNGKYFTLLNTNEILNYKRAQEALLLWLSYFSLFLYLLFLVLKAPPVENVHTAKHSYIICREHDYMHIAR